MISFGRGICGNFADSSGREWLETNGLGGYAMGTVSGGNTRRYHGLLSVALKPPVRRFQLVNRLEESIALNGERHGLSCQSYPGAVYPPGFRHIERFRLDPFPVWTFSIGDVRLEKTFFLRYGEDTAVALYRLISGPPVELEVRPLLTGRDHHHATREDDRFRGRIEASPRLVRVSMPPGPTLHIGAHGGEFSEDGFWYRNQEYAWEEHRGLDHREDAYAPGAFRFRLEAGAEAALVFSAAERRPAEAADWSRQERLLRHQVLEKALVRGPLADVLVSAADQFVVAREGRSSVVAGYPWFEDWGRDAMVSLPGLCLAAGRPQEAEEVLETFARHARNGLVPNRFPDGGADADYNSVDAPLWFVWAAQKFYQAQPDAERLRKLLPALRQVVDSYQRGTLFGIRMEADGLIEVSEPSLTWMDARVDGRPVTPRTGKPVEVQALWYNALQFLAELDLKLKEPSRGYEKLASIARTSFNEKFWNEGAQYLFDRVEGRERDASVRPNALIAISLPYEVLEESRFKPVVETAARELYTTYGLRTLAPREPGYRGRFQGPPSERDASYHQGAVWPWLMGPFVTAFVKAHGPSEATKARVNDLLTPFLDHLSEAGVGTVSELFEGDAPHAPRGCPAQAWSVGEILRVLWEEGLVV
jgi:predicted glycogen debranching enzyme